MPSTDQPPKRNRSFHGWHEGMSPDQMSSQPVVGSEREWRDSLGQKPPSITDHDGARMICMCLNCVRQRAIIKDPIRYLHRAPVTPPPALAFNTGFLAKLLFVLAVIAILSVVVAGANQ